MYLKKSYDFPPVLRRSYFANSARGRCMEDFISRRILHARVLIRFAVYMNPRAAASPSLCPLCPARPFSPHSSLCSTTRTTPTLNDLFALAAADVINTIPSISSRTCSPRIAFTPPMFFYRDNHLTALAFVRRVARPPVRLTARRAGHGGITARCLWLATSRAILRRVPSVHSRVGSVSPRCSAVQGALRACVRVQETAAGCARSALSP
ncbi:hypothetical protein FB451DRAFT_1529428 [Mycena latifolia]|nr:hypothetical protein FB451DRAFT_1529428 [Mycena latifolia]